MRSLTRFAPWLTLAVLCGFAQWLPNRVALDEDAAQRRAVVVAAVEGAPFFVGDWIGRDEPVPREAQKLLRPNAMLSRVYRRPGGVPLHLVMVHCGDARDMIGHYPPVCYPGAGWLDCPLDGTENVTVEAAGRRLPVRLYEFRRLREHGREERIRIFNAFVLPGGAVTSEISDINDQTQRRAVSARGVAQLQVIAPAELDRATMIEDAGELLGGLPDLLDALEVEREGRAR